MSEGWDLQIDSEADPTASDEGLGEECRACRGTGELGEAICPKCGGVGWAGGVSGDV